MRYLSQRFSMKDDVAKAMLTDIGTEELAHLEMVGAIVHQLTKNTTTGEIENSPMAAYYIDHNKGVYPAAASGNPWKAEYIGVKGDPIADLTVKEVYEFLAYLGAPEAIMTKAPSAALFEGQSDEEDMGIKYADIDKFLLAGSNWSNLMRIKSFSSSGESRDAEWYFLKGSVLYRRGWLEEAKEHFFRATQMDPENMEYRNAYNQAM